MKARNSRVGIGEQVVVIHSHCTHANKCGGAFIESKDNIHIPEGTEGIVTNRKPGNIRMYQVDFEGYGKLWVWRLDIDKVR